MLDLFCKKHSQAGLRMLFKTAPRLAGQAQPDVFILMQIQMQGHFAEQNERWVLKSRASSLAKGFESASPAWLAQAQPCSFI